MTYILSGPFTTDLGFVLDTPYGTEAAIPPVLEGATLLGTIEVSGDSHRKNKPIYLQEDNSIVWRNMRTVFDEIITDATVTFNLKDSQEAIIASGPLDQFGDINDPNYRGVIDKTVPLIKNKKYTLEITATQNENDGFRKINCTGKFHAGEP